MFRYALVSIVFSALLLGCDFKVGNERAFKSSNPEYMENFMALLDKRGISYQYTDGYFRYTTDVESQVEEVKKRLSSTKSVKYEDEAVRKYFRSLLDKEGIEYLPLKKEGGSWTMWWPESEGQEQAIQLKAVEFAFANKKNGQL
jgi:hypothetical protein